VLPGGDRHTPYVILDLGKGATPQAQASFSSTITSAEMHEVLLNAAMRPR
jgi:hypothetical protein